MKKLQLPSSYAALSPEEQCAAFGGSEFGDAVGSFFLTICTSMISSGTVG